jgi:rubrerythrin
VSEEKKMNLFTIKEVVNIGIEKEKKRRDFYGFVSAHFDNQEIRNLFQQLRDWEEMHIKKFTEIKDAMPEDETTESYPGELNDYMKVLVDDKLYRQITPVEFSKHIHAPLDAIYYGIEFEKDAILLFNELRNAAPQGRSQVIDTLIAEEKQHIVFLALLQQKFIQKTK